MRPPGLCTCYMLAHFASPNPEISTLLRPRPRPRPRRTAEEFGAGHVPQAVNVPIQFKGEGGKMEPNPDFFKQVGVLRASVLSMQE